MCRKPGGGVYGRMAADWAGMLFYRFCPENETQVAESIF